MKKILMAMFLIAFSLLLVACLETGEGNGNGNGGDEEPTAEEIFESKFEFLDDNNYQLEIKIRDHQAVADTIAYLYFDGTTVKYEDESYVAYYDNSGSKSMMYVKQGDTYLESESNFKNSSLLYYGFEFEQFTANGTEAYIMNQDAYGSLDNFIGLEDEVTSIKSLQFRVNDSAVTEVIFDIEVGETTYLVTLTISNIGQVELVLPA